jgi:hypothetical protein
MWIGIKSTTMVLESIDRAAYSLPPPFKTCVFPLWRYQLLMTGKSLYLSKKAVNYFVLEEVAN